MDEDLCPRPRDVYEATKLAVEEPCRDFDRPELSVACLRVARCFPEQPRETAVHRPSRGIDVRDAVESYPLAVERPDAVGTFIVTAPSPFR